MPDKRWWKMAASAVAVGLVAAACGATRPDTGASEPAPTAIPEPTAAVLDGPGVVLVADVQQRDTSPGANGVAVNQVVQGTNEFAVSFFKKVADPNENTVVGNYSLSSVLLLAMAGTAGDTTSAFADLLGVDSVAPDELHPAVNALDLVLESRAGDGVELSTANSLFVQDGFELDDHFLNTAVGSYGAPVRAVDFQGSGEEATDAVNQWVADQTDGFIEKLTDGYPSNTVVVLANAMYLKAVWGVKFRRLENPGPFHRSDRTTVDVDLMAHDQYLPLFHGNDVVAVELPYAGGNLGLVVIEPNNLADFEAQLSAERLVEITDGLKEGGIHLTMPIWSTKTSVEALEPLHELGLPTTYDFSGMISGGDSGYGIDSVSHVARIEVDEEGTTAAAATDVVIPDSHGPSIDINRPFFYFIRDRGSNAILFLGHIADPSQTAG